MQAKLKVDKEVERNERVRKVMLAILKSIGLHIIYLTVISFLTN